MHLMGSYGLHGHRGHPVWPQLEPNWGLEGTSSRNLTSVSHMQFLPIFPPIFSVRASGVHHSQQPHRRNLGDVQ